MEPTCRTPLYADGIAGRPALGIYRCDAARPIGSAAFDVLPSTRPTRIVIHFYREQDHEHGSDCLALPCVPGFRACLHFGGN